MSTYPTRIATCPDCEGSGRYDNGKLCATCEASKTVNFEDAIRWRIEHAEDAETGEDAFTEWLAAFLRDYMMDRRVAVARTLWKNLGREELISMMDESLAARDGILAARKRVKDAAARAKVTT